MSNKFFVIVVIILLALVFLVYYYNKNIQKDDEQKDVQLPVEEEKEQIEAIDQVSVEEFNSVETSDEILNEINESLEFIE